jgi:hypothetical protein
MTEVWLHPNRRVLLLSMVPVALLGGLGVVILNFDMPTSIKVVAWVALGTACLLMSGLVQQVLRPRIGYREGLVCFYLKAGSPIKVPLHVVEAFFLGQGPAHLPGSDEEVTKTVNLVARLSQREVDWAEKEVKEALGSWREGYITMRGTWCEPLTTEVIRRLNHRLSEIKQVVSNASKEEQRAR